MAGHRPTHPSSPAFWKADTSGARTATESQKLARLAKSQGRPVIIVSDEYCHWSGDVSDAAIFAPSRTGMFLESTVGIVAALNLMVDCAAKADERAAMQRLIQWKSNSRRLGLF